ncbi:hypothetical protein PCASD_17849 [Puccinia coronata f. sp. avenae]|jgi:hypothetical protein|nr:hypothetical protein PCASD_17849 [Puccinia coronata f. sp. avenae]
MGNPWVARTINGLGSGIALGVSNPAQPACEGCGPPWAGLRAAQARPIIILMPKHGGLVNLTLFRFPFEFSAKIPFSNLFNTLVAAPLPSNLAAATTTHTYNVSRIFGRT